MPLITISKSTSEEIQEFNDREWVAADTKYYGQATGWIKEKYILKFDIDFSTCLWCGLCTVVCPTQCLTMTKEYEFSVTDKKDLVWQFGENLEVGPKQ